MKTKNTAPTIESYYLTESEWYNKHVIDLIASIKEKGNFESLLEPIQFYDV